MPWLETARDWPGAMAGWDAGRLARHAAHAARFVAAGWRADTADLVAFDLVIEGDEAGRDEIRGRGESMPARSTSRTGRSHHDASTTRR